MTTKSTLSRRLLLPLGAMALTLGLSSTALAGPPEGRGGKLGKVCQKIECSDDQKTELKQIHKEMRTDAKSDREAIRELHKQMAAEWVKSAPNEKVLDRIQAKIAVHEANIADRRMDMMLELHAVLSPEQRKAFAKLMAERHGKKGKRGKKGKNKVKNGKNKQSRSNG